MEKKVTSHYVKGLVIGIAVVVIGILFQVFDIYERWVQWLVLGCYVASIIWVCYSFSVEKDGDVTFGSVFGHGFKTAALVAIIAIGGFILTTFLMPEVKEKIMSVARTEMEKNPQMTDEVVDKAMEFTSKYYFLFGVVGSLFSYAFFGGIASLIGAGVAKKNPNQNMPKSI
jgi:Protein of unknown function (DUF4199)